MAIFCIFLIFQLSGFMLLYIDITIYNQYITIYNQYITYYNFICIHIFEMDNFKN